MGNWKLARWQEPQTLTRDVLREMRRGRPAGMSRRTLIRRSLGAGIGLWTLEVLGGTLGFLWPQLGVGFGASITVGDQQTVADLMAVPDTRLDDGAPAYISLARAYVLLLDPARGFINGASADGAGDETNLRTLYQRCPHLGCKPNFCTVNYYFECACHGSRYDRLGIKVLELGPAPRSMDWFAHTVENGVLTIDTSRITLGPLPVATGQPGLIPARSPRGCAF
jgi:cytochrome b6-f complex iron-sulfur subunit